MELRYMFCESHTIPSATVKTGLDSASGNKYSPIKKVVACQLVICMPSCCTKRCNSDPPCSIFFPDWTTDRNESTKTRLDEKSFTSWAMRDKTRSKSPSSRSLERLTKRIDSLILSKSKNENCC